MAPGKEIVHDYHCRLGWAPLHSNGSVNWTKVQQIGVLSLLLKERRNKEEIHVNRSLENLADVSKLLGKIAIKHKNWKAMIQENHFQKIWYHHKIVVQLSLILSCGPKYGTNLHNYTLWPHHHLKKLQNFHTIIHDGIALISKRVAERSNYTRQIYHGTSVSS